MNGKLIALLFVAFLLSGAILYNQNQVPQSIAPETEATDANKKFAPFPDITFKTVDGQPVRIQDLKEKTVLVHFWAAWCGPCHAEFPDLLRYVERAKGNIALLSISLDGNYDDSQHVLNEVERKHNVSVHGPHLYWVSDRDRSLSLQNFNTVKVPETIVVNQGLMIDKIVGGGPWAEAAKPEAQY